MIKPVIRGLQALDTKAVNLRWSIYHRLHKKALEPFYMQQEKLWVLERKYKEILELHDPVWNGEDGYTCRHCSNNEETGAKAYIYEAGLSKSWSEDDWEKWLETITEAKTFKVPYPCYDIRVMEGIQDDDEAIAAFVEKVKENDIMRRWRDD